MRSNPSTQLRQGFVGQASSVEASERAQIDGSEKITSLSYNWKQRAFFSSLLLCLLGLLYFGHQNVHKVFA